MITGSKNHIAHQVVELPANDLSPPSANQLVGYLKTAGRQDSQGNFWEPLQVHFTLQPGELAELCPVDAHRDDIRICLVRDHAGPLIDLHQGTRRCQATFRKDDAMAFAANLLDKGFG